MAHYFVGALLLTLYLATLPRGTLAHEGALTYPTATTRANAILSSHSMDIKAFISAFRKIIRGKSTVDNLGVR